MSNKNDKIILVSKAVHKQLTLVKIKKDMKSLSETIKYLLKTSNIKV